MTHPDDVEYQARAIESWRLNPITSLLVRWMMPDVGNFMGQLESADLSATWPPPARACCRCSCRADGDQ